MTIFIILITIVLFLSAVIWYIHSKTRNIREFTVNVFVDFGDELNDCKKPVFSIKSNLSLNNRSDLHADPFLFVKDKSLYLFMEEAYIEEPLRGKIRVFRTQDMVEWEDLGIVLEQECHLSFPFVFENDGHFFMIPETGERKEIALYESNSFPFDWEKRQIFLKGVKYLDSHLCNFNNTWFLFTNPSENSLDLYYSDSLTGPWIPHIQNPIVSGLNKSRSAGSIININGKLLRPAQDCSSYYGANFSLYEIINLDKKGYAEKIYKDKVIDYRSKWNELGGHHLNFVKFLNHDVYVLDGLSEMSLYNRIKFYLIYFFTIKFKFL